MNCISCSVVSKIFFYSEFLDIPEESRQGKKSNGKAIAKGYSLQENRIKVNHVIKGLCDFMEGSSSLYLTTHP